MCEATPALYPAWLYGVDKDSFTFLPEDFLQVLWYKVKAFFFCERALITWRSNFLYFVRNICYSDEYLASYTCEMLPQNASRPLRMALVTDAQF
jgi:hypothetical protein